MDILRGRKHASRVISFIASALLLSVSSSTSIFVAYASAGSGEPAPEAKATPAPSPADFAELEAKEREHGDWLSSPEAAKQREASRTAYGGVSPNQAGNLLLSVFPAQINALDADPARVLSELDIERTLGTYAALVSDKHGEHSIVESSVPIKSEVGGLGKQPVDLMLQRSGVAFVPKNPLTEVKLPGNAGDPIRLGIGIAVELPTSSDQAAEVLGDKSLFYAETDASTDTFIAPIAAGVEVFQQLRSPESPQQFSFTLSLPAGAELRESEVGGVEIVSDEGNEIGWIPPATAVDAQGTAVPVRMFVEDESLVVEVDHRSRDVAYPLLLDPQFIEEGYVSYGHWQASKNAEYDLYNSSSLSAVARGNSYTYGANTYGQWIYTAPGQTGYIAAATFFSNSFNLPSNCATEQPTSQPHGYVGLYNPYTGGWGGLGQWYGGSSYNSEFQTGWVGGPGVRQAVVGIGTGSSSVHHKCAFSFSTGGVTIQERDPEPPTWNSNPAVADQWIDGGAIPVSVSASDPGLGMKYFNLFTTDSSGKAQTLVGNAVHSCSGALASPCPSSWATQISNYSPASLPTGINTMAVIAYDALGTEHNSEGRAVFLKVDHRQPVIRASGELLSEHPIKYHLEVEAEDGWVSGKDLTTAQSGVKKVEFFLDGDYAGVFPQGSQPACSNVQEGINIGSCKFKEIMLDLPRWMEGKHSLEIVATDSLNHQTSEKLELDLPKDTTAPELKVSGPLYSASGRWVNREATSVSIEAADLETGVTEATVYVDGEEVTEPTQQQCEFGGCPLNHAFAISLEGYEEEQHTIKVIAKDHVGNVAEESWTVTVDATQPTLQVSTTPELPSGWNPQLEGFAVDYAAADNAAGTAGSGITKVTATLPAVNGNTDSNLYSSSCSGSVESPCQQEAEGSKTPLWVYFLKEGVNDIPVKAYDAAGNVSGAQTLTVHIDRSTPRVTATGPLMEAEGESLVGLGTELDLSVHDGGSGVGAVELLLDGEVEQTLSLEEIEADGGTQTCSEGEEGTECDLAYTFVPEVGEALPAGKHNFMVRVKDRVEHSASRSHAVAIDTKVPEATLSGVLAESAGHELEIPEASLQVAATDPEGEVTSGIKWIVVAVDGAQVTALNNCEAAPCAPAGELAYTYSEEDWGAGPHEVEVLVTDGVGNTIERRLMVNAPITAVAPECPTEPQETVEAAGVVTPSEASQMIASALPGAVAPTEPAPSEPAGESPFDPSITEEGQHSIDEQGIDVVGTPTGGGIEDTSSGSFTVGQAVCMQPLQKTSATSAPIEVGGDAALYANSAPETDTVVRPAAFGTTVIEHLRGPAAPSSFSWEVKLELGEELRKLSNGSVVVVKTGIDTNEVEIPAGVPDLTPAAIPDVEAQQLRSGANLAEANNSVEGEVTAVIATPQAVLADGSTAPALLQISGGQVVTATLPPSLIAETIAMVIEANTAAEPEAMCAQSFQGDPGLYVDGCSEPADPNAEPLPSADESVSLDQLSLQALSPQLRADFASGLNPELGATASSLTSPSEQDKAWCGSYWERAIFCAYFYKDQEFAVAKENELFNLDNTDSTKANAFRHVLWVSAMINSAPPDIAALKFAMNHERGQRNDPYRKTRYKSYMDGLNNFTAWVYTAYSEINDQEACEHFVGKVGAARFIGFDQNPIAWANRVSFEHRNLVYRRKYEKVAGQRIRIHLISQNCG